MSAAGQERETEERRREALKLNFDYLKHLSTLAGATALVELAVYKEVGVGLSSLGTSLLLLAVCVGACLYNMGLISGDMQSGEYASGGLYRLGIFGGIYVGGLAAFAWAALNPSSAEFWGGIVLVIVFILLYVVWRRWM